MSSDDNFHQGGLYQNRPQKNQPNSHSLGNISSISGTALKPTPIITDDLLLMRKKSRSREAINLGSHGLPISSSDIKFKSDSDSNGKLDSSVIFTTARPATVISASSSTIASSASAAAAASTSNGNATNNHNHHNNEHNILHIKEENNIRMTPRKHTINPSAIINKRKGTDNLMQQPLPLLPDSKEVDWTRLVDHAIMQVNEGLKNSESNKHTTYYDDTQEGLQDGGLSSHSSSVSSETASSSGSSNQHQMPPSTSLPELQSQVSQLEDRISKETRRRKSLEQAVRRLTDENRRLQDESQAAVQQLRRFTEWFFQTIDRQS